MVLPHFTKNEGSGMRCLWASGHVLLALALGLQSCNRLGRQAAEPPPRVIQAGQAAPDIEGIDLDGNPLKLSEQRGKVVALVFWGHW
jgi:hypothetical protein